MNCQPFSTLSSTSAAAAAAAADTVKFDLSGHTVLSRVDIEYMILNTILKFALFCLQLGQVGDREKTCTKEQT